MHKIKLFFDTGLLIEVSLLRNDFVDRWADLLRQEIASKSILQTDTFSSLMTEQESQHHLVSAIDTVNRWLKRDFFVVPSQQDFKDQHYYNQLHERFEKIAGPDWDHPTRMIKVAPPEVRSAVRHINRFCHRLERQPYEINRMLRVEFDTHRREPLRPDDYDLFQTRVESGMVFLDYGTLGKSIWECYQDYLPPNYPGMRAQRHYAANFILKFGEINNPRSPEGFDDWLQQHKVDPSVLKGNGYIPLGKIESPKQFDSVFKCRSINKITLE